ncbi:endonuclease [Halobacteriovorax sp. GB3]|uniref:endonuclease I family protein n=1 Tax=Halobacteriovorax sp. GB3 TaxID=2719615 RepID=UPI00235EE034|nr:endonuclease [Halobacteriovorax sp. GB3]MDD0851544.1 endonuclease [Halobacteriovorax sp. GB3]
MRKLALLLLVAPTLCLAANDYYPQDFQEKVERNELKDERLINEIHTLLTTQHQRMIDGPDKLGCSRSQKGQCYRQISLGYKGARQMLFGKLHLEQDQNGYFVKDVYCNKVYRSSTPGIGKLGPEKIPNANMLNCEHTWPQSRFPSGDKGMKKADLHHLFPTENRANGIRGNYGFADVENDSHNSSLCAASKQDRKRFFEPPDEHKGNVARALFYFSIRYQTSIDSKQEATMKRWHILDPVDGAERERNEEIYKLQNNRNPFIDYPELVDQISDF